MQRHAKNKRPSGQHTPPPARVHPSLNILFYSKWSTYLAPFAMYITHNKVNDGCMSAGHFEINQVHILKA